MEQSGDLYISDECINGYTQSCGNEIEIFQAVTKQHPGVSVVLYKKASFCYEDPHTVTQMRNGEVIYTGETPIHTKDYAEEESVIVSYADFLSRV